MRRGQIQAAGHALPTLPPRFSSHSETSSLAVPDRTERAVGTRFVIVNRYFRLRTEYVKLLVIVRACFSYNHVLLIG